VPGYDTVNAIARDHPEWLERVRVCHELGKFGADFAGRWVNDRTGDRTNLTKLVTWGVLERTDGARGGHRAYYKVLDRPGVGRALRENGLAAPD
jgi:hypothetical protein